MSTSRTIYFKGGLSTPEQLVECKYLLVIRTKPGRDIEQLIATCKGLGNCQIERISRFTDANVSVHRFVGGNIGRKEVKSILRKQLANDIEYVGTLLQYKKSEVFQIYTGNIYLEFSDHISQEQANALMKKWGIKIKRSIDFSHNGYFGEPQLQKGKNIFKFCERLLKQHKKIISHCHPELVSELRTENCRFSRPGGQLSNLPADWWLQKVDAYKAWEIAQGEGITIAIIDDGIEFNHPAFKGKIVHPIDMMTKEGNRLPLHKNVDRHGTPCASIACSADQKAPGIAPAAKVMPIRANSLGSIRQSEAIIWAVDHGADIISCSWGPPDGLIESFDDDDLPYPIPDHLQRAFEYAANHGRNGKGCPIIFAAGNGYEPNNRDGYITPDEVLAVTACNHKDMPTYYGDYGYSVFCAFPSGDFPHGPMGDPSLDTGILVADRIGQFGYEKGNYYSLFSGTSASCPGVAGVIALMLSANPLLTYAEIKTLLKVACDKIGMEHGVRYDQKGFSKQFGHGRLNALKAVQLAKNHSPNKNLPPMDKPKKTAISLHIGIDQVDQSYYGGYVPDLLGCVNDMNSMKAFAKKRGYEPHTLSNAQATKEAIRQKIVELGNQVEDGGILLISYAGHGTQLPNNNHALDDNEQDFKDETWVTYNGFLLDDEIYNCLSEIQGNIRVVLMSDSCHSETMSRDFYIGRDIRSRMLPPDKTKQILKKNNQTANGLRSAIGGKRNNFNVAVLNLSACESDETAKEENGAGVFTSNIIEACEDLGRNGNYFSLMDEVREQVETTVEDQTPNYSFSHHGSKRFFNDFPFSTEPIHNNKTPHKVNKFSTPPPPSSSFGKNFNNQNGHTNGQSSKKSTNDELAQTYSFDESTESDLHKPIIYTKPSKNNHQLEELLVHKNKKLKVKSLNGKRSLGSNTWDDAYQYVMGSKKEQVDFVEPNMLFNHNEHTSELIELYRSDQKGSGDYLSTYPPYMKNEQEEADFIWHLRDEFSELESANKAVFPEVAIGKRSIDRKVVRIAHIDTGILPDHPSTPLNLIRKYEIQPSDAEKGAIDDENWWMPDIIEKQGHGQGTASILAGNWVDLEHTDNRYKGFFGAIPYAEILPIKISDTVALFTGRLFADAVDYAIEQGCDVITLSMAGLPSRVMAKAVDKAYENGVVLVAAGSNCWSKGLAQIAPKKMLYPARYDRAIAVVGCTHSNMPYLNKMNQRPRAAGGEYMQSCYGPKSALPSTIAAYSPNITWFNQMENSNGKTSYYVRSGGGTSSATPQVAAAAALYIQKYKDELSNLKGKNAWKKVEIVRQALFRSAEDSVYNKEYFGNGMLKANRALADEYTPAEMLKIIKEAKPSVRKNLFKGILNFFGIRGGLDLSNINQKNDDDGQRDIIKAMLMTEVQQLLCLDKKLHIHEDLEIARGKVNILDYPDFLQDILDSEHASDFLKKAISQNFRQSRGSVHGGRKELSSKLGKTVVSSMGADFTILNENYHKEGSGDNTYYIDEFELVVKRSDRNFANGVANIQLEITHQEVSEDHSLTNNQLEKGDEIHSVVLVESVFEDGSVLEWQAAPHARATIKDDKNKLQELFPTHLNKYVLYSNQAGDRSIKKKVKRFFVKAVKWIVKKSLKEELPKILKDENRIQELADKIGDSRYELMIYDLDHQYTNTKSGWANFDDFNGTDKNRIRTALMKPDKKALFFLPGLFSTVEKGFEEFLDNKYVRIKLAELHCRYIVGVNMPTLLHGIENNAKRINKDLKEKLKIEGKACNVIARSRGGLVARYLFEETWLNNAKSHVNKNEYFDNAPFHLHKMVMTGPPNEGTKIASTDNWRNLLNTVVNVAKFTVGAVLPVVPKVLSIIKAIGLGATELAGINDLEEDSLLLQKLNNLDCDRSKYHVLTSNFEPQKGWFKRLLDERIVDRAIFKNEHNDSITPLSGALLQNDQFKKKANVDMNNCEVCGSERGVSHFSYLDPKRHPKLVLKIVDEWLS